MDQALARLERVTERLERLEAARTAGASPSAAAQQLGSVAAAAPAAPSHAAADAKLPSNGPPAAGSWPQLLQSYLPPLVQATGSLTDPEVMHLSFSRHCIKQRAKLMQGHHTAQGLLLPVTFSLDCLTAAACGNSSPHATHQCRCGCEDAAGPGGVPALQAGL